jgi:hypothetical protein
MKYYKVIAIGVISSTLFTGCVSDIASLASDVSTIMDTGTQAFNMVQSVEIDGARNRGFSDKDYKKLKSLAIKFNSNADWWAKGGSGFTDNIETQLMKLGFDTYKYSDSDNNAWETTVTSKKVSVRTLAKKLKKENVQALITGTVKGSAKYSSSFGSGEFKTLITAVNFSIVETTNGKTMASINLSYKKGVSNIQASKDVAKALKALVEYPNMKIEDAFKKLSTKK